MWTVPQTNTSPTRIWLAFLFSRRLPEDGTPMPRHLGLSHLSRIVFYYVNVLVKVHIDEFCYFCPAFNFEFDVISLFCKLFFHKALTVRVFFFTDLLPTFSYGTSCTTHKHCKWTRFVQQKTYSGGLACTLLDSPYIIELLLPYDRREN